MSEISLDLKDGLYCTTIQGKSFAFKKLTWGEKNKVISISQKINPLNGSFMFDIETFNVNLLLATVKKAPFNLSREGFETYPDAKLVDTLLEIATKMNLADPVKIQNL